MTYYEQFQKKEKYANNKPFRSVDRLHFSSRIKREQITININ